MRGRGRSRGHRRGLLDKQERSKESSTLEFAEISSSDENDKDPPKDERDEKNDRSHQVRRVSFLKQQQLYPCYKVLMEFLFVSKTVV